VDGLDLNLQRLHQAGKPWRLAARQLEDEAAERRRVDHRVLERPGEAAAEDPGVEGVMAVLHQHGSPGEVEKGPSCIAELGCVDQHLALDQVPPPGVGIDRSTGVDQGVEQAQRPAQPKPLGADLEDQEGPVPGGLDVHRPELGLLQKRLRADRRIVVAQLGRLPGDELGSPTGLEPKWPLGRFCHGSHPRVTHSP
jgi:hypothetical protein